VRRQNHDLGRLHGPILASSLREIHPAPRRWLDVVDSLQYDSRITEGHRLTSTAVNKPTGCPPLATRLFMKLAPFLPIPERRMHALLLQDNTREHREHGWARLREISDLGRYSVIRGYCEFFKPQASILDIGCGEGILQEQLAYQHYTGIELFADSLQRAAHKSDARTRFIQADAAAYQPDRRFDVIVWNESLYYLAEPLQAAKRYLEFLEHDGITIVSMFYQMRTSRRLFGRLEILGRIEAELRVSNCSGSWLVRVYKRDAAPKTLGAK
jgi:SAM-dependent methyltransferase